MRIIKHVSQSFTQRKYSTIELIDIGASSHNALTKVFEKFGPYLRTLTILSSKLDDFTILTILRCSPYLKELCVSEVTIEQKLPAVNPVSIVHLKTVTIHHTSWLIFQFLARSQITSLLINNYVDEVESTRMNLVRMLSNQYRLKVLMLHGTSSKMLFKNGDLNNIRNFHLTKFHISSGFGQNSEAVGKNIVNFLTSHGETLDDVEISTPNSERIAMFALRNLENLTSLALHVGKLSKDPMFYELLGDIEPNFRLKHLKLSGFFVEPEFVKSFLCQYPALVHLELDDWSNTTFISKIFKFVAETFPHLQKLFVPGISNEDDVQSFSSLKELHVSYIRNVENLIDFIRQNNSLEALKIGLVNVEQIPSICRLLKFAPVQRMSFAGNSESLKKIFDFVQANTPEKLKTLELSLILHENYFKLSNTVRKSIKMNFVNNETDLRNKRMEAFLQ